MEETMANRIEKNVTLDAPVGRVWEALTDHRQFGDWFGVLLDGPFEAGKASRGKITHPGYEHLKWEANIEAMEPERRFAMTWHPYAVDPEKDYSGEHPTRVEFALEPEGAGTKLRVTEDGFDKVPEDRRDEAYRMNESGWEAQMENIGAYLMLKR
jgi:uncharacterized protein YndB with AHSA1/START domain